MIGWVSRVFVRSAAVLVPRERRPRFLREWRAELAHEVDDVGRLGAMRLAIGAFADALAIRRIDAEHESSGRTRSAPGLRHMAGDLRVAARALRREPAFTMAAVVTLALGMGGSGAIYSLLDGVVLDPLPYPDPQQLVHISNRVPGVAADAVWGASTAQQMYYAEHASTLQSVGLFRTLGANMETPGGPVRAFGWRTTTSVFPMLGLRPMLGRLFVAEDDRPGAPPVVVLSHSIWQQQFGGDRNIVGSSITIDGRPAEVVGVLEPGGAAPLGPPGYRSDLWVPLQIDPDGYFGNNHVYTMVARLREGYDVSAAEVELANLERQLPERFPRAYSESFFDGSGFYTQAVPLKEAVVGDMARNLWILMGAVAIVLVAACANVANLLVARLESKDRELMVRRALGASRVALARYLMSEALVLSVLGGGLGLAIVWLGGPALFSIAPDSLPRIESFRLDLGTFLFIGGLAATVGVALGGYALLRSGKDTGRGLVSAGRRHSAGKKRQTMRGALVVTQIALATALVVGAGLLLESMRRLNAIDPGFDAEGVLTARLFLTPTRYDADEQMWSAYSAILERVRSIPGVVSAGMAQELPVEGNFGCTSQGFEERAVYDRLSEAGLSTCAGQERHTPGYFEAIGIPLLQGRVLTDADNLDPTRGSVVVSKSFADRFWPSENAIGKGVAPNGRNVEPFYRVVGIVGDHPAGSLDGDPAIAIYYPIVDNPDTPGNWGWWRPSSLSLAVKSDRPDPMDLLPAIRRAVNDVDPTIPIVRARPMTEVVEESIARFAFVSTLLAVAAAVALTVAAIGIYGVVSYIVSRSTGEIGMRVAVGARPAQVEALFVKRALILASCGLVIGLGLAAGLTRVLQGLLYGVERGNPVSYVAAGSVLLVAALVASWIPARRAAAVEPVVALRAE